MRLVRVLRATLLGFAFSASFAGAQGICDMPADEAHISTQCVRWYSVCCMRQKPRWPPQPQFSSLTYWQLKEALVDACYKVAEESCLYFDYTAADSARRSALERIED